MSKEGKKNLIITTAATLLPILIGLIFWDRLPEQMATHFDAAGDANGWSSKYFAVFGIPVFIAVVNVISVFFTENDPKYDKYPKKMLRLLYCICPLISWFCAFLIYGDSLGMDIGYSNLGTSLFVGLLFILIGNYLPKVKQNYYIGIKLPWTYADEENWNKTHRLAGKIWVIGGLLIVLNAFLKIKGLEIAAFVIMVLVPTVYSFRYSRRGH